MTPKAAAAAELIQVTEQVPAALAKIARAQEIRLERLDALHERLSVWMLEKQAAALRTKEAAAESLGPAQDPQNVQPTVAPQHEKTLQDPQNVQPTVAPQREKTLQELMGTPDIQKWFQRSVKGLAKRGQIPYALLSPGQEPETNLQHEELKALLQQLLEAKGSA